MLGGLGMRELCRGLRSDPYLGRGADMRSGLRAHSYVAYAGFWAVTLSLKFGFDYFAIVQPMVQVAATPCLDTIPTHHAFAPRLYIPHMQMHMHMCMSCACIYRAYTPCQRTTRIHHA